MTTDARALLMARMTEKQWQAHVRQYAELCGWHVHAVYDSRHSPEGWPDLYLVKNGRAIAAELKTETGVATAAQRLWLEWLSACGTETYIWRPSHEAEVQRILGGGS